MAHTNFSLWCTPHLTIPLFALAESEADRNPHSTIPLSALAQSEADQKVPN